ncbi:MAG: Ig-like domain-containing protein [Terracidiphilus sp.]|nr:Ig-like domain-containing protein [Terracidiphilus sp.]
MLNRAGLNMLLAGLALVVVGCSNTEVGYIQISPATQSLAAGQTVQLTASGIIGHGTHPTTSQDVTNQVIWASSTPAVATVSSSGLATAVSIGTTTISASMSGATGSTATITVTSGGGGTGGATLASLAIIPGAQSVASPGQTSQFIAIGTTSSGATENLTSQVAWSSSSTQIATISAGGLATGLSKGTTTITAIATISGSAVVTATATFTVIGGAAEPITALSISPGSLSLSATGQTGQFIALGTSGSTGLQQDVTNSTQLAWSSSIPTIATISASGLATGVSAGSTTITAKWTNPDNSVASATASVTVTLTSAPEPLLSLTIIPSTITVGNLQDTGNFLVIGTYSTSPTVRDVTNSVTWLSSEPNVFPVNTGGSAGATAGIVTAYGAGSAVIIAEATDLATGSIQTATATFSCPLVLPNPPTTPGSCYPGSQASSLLSTVTVYNEGLNTTTWLVEANSATGTKNVIHCGPGWAKGGGTGGSVCVATYPVGTTVTLTAPAGTGAFGGWSSNCTPNPNPPTATGPNQCTMITTTTNQTVGAIFN